LISGPSLLGLNGSSDSGNGRYLLEDEEPRRGLYLVVVLILVALGIATWGEARLHGISLLALLKGSGTRSAAVEKKADRAPQQETQSQPLPSENSTSETAGKTQGATAEAASAQKADQALNAEPIRPQASDFSAKAPATVETPGSKQTATDEGSSAGTGPASRAGQPGEIPTEKPAKAEPAAPSGPVRTALDAGETRTSSASARNRSASGVTRTTPSQGPSDQDATILVAEKYLYGQGVPQDCNRALSLLQPAADASSAKARSILGTMYATGHCVPRDLPSSYRWFALALRQQPNNIWLEKNVETIWNQMTASEKQLAMRLAK
jgi:TPR repeat protein